MEINSVYGKANIGIDEKPNKFYTFINMTKINDISLKNIDEWIRYLNIGFDIR